MPDMYIGRTLKSGKVTSEKYFLNSLDLSTHIFICGSTGSGKTVLGKCLIEEAIKCKIPSIVIDLKGDLSSLKIPLFDLSETEISDFIDGYSEADHRERMKKTVAEYKNALSLGGLTVNDIQALRNRAAVRILTPKSRICEQFSISFLASPPSNLDEIMRAEPEIVINQVTNQASNILKRLFGEGAMLSMAEEKNLLETAIMHLYKCQADLEGRSGIINLIKTIHEMPFDRIGMLKVKEFISDERKMTLIRRLNTLLVGAESLWYEGESIERLIPELISGSNEEKTNVFIFNLSFLESFDDRNIILANIATTLFNYVKKLGDSREPRVLFYVDEIGGGKLSFFPDDPIQNESKSAINLLLRQGRAFGLGCILATQNPGDIDYRGLTNCHTWYIGRLLTKPDREKVVQGISATPYFLERFEDFLKSAGSGDFIVKSKDGQVTAFKERWLLTFHKVLTYDDFLKLKKSLVFADDVLIGANHLGRREFILALPVFERALKKSPDSAKVLGFLGETHYGLGSYKESLACFDRVLKAKEPDYPLAKCFYFMGEIAMKGGVAEKAIELFSRSIKTDGEYADSYFRMAEILFEAGRNPEALQNIQKYVVLRSSSDKGYYLMARIQMAQGDYPSAENFVKKAFANSKEPSVRYTYKFLEAKLNFLQGQFAHSLETLDEAQKMAKSLGSEPAECDLLLASIYAKFKENAKAVTYFESAISKNPTDEEALSQLAELYFQTGQNEKTAETIDRLAKVNESNVNTFVLRARLLIASGKPADAMRFVESAPKDSSGRDRIETTRGMIFEALGQREKAMESYENATGINPRCEEALYHIARSYETSGDLENQCKTLQRLVEFSNDEKYFQELGLCHEKLNQYEPAIAAFNRLYLTTLQNPEINLKKASWYRKLKNVQKAYECLDLYIKAKPNSPDGYLVKGEIFTLEQKYDEALELYDRAEGKCRDASKVWLSRSFTYREMGEIEKAEFCQDKAMGK